MNIISELTKFSAQGRDYKEDKLTQALCVLLDVSKTFKSKFLELIFPQFVAIEHTLCFSTQYTYEDGRADLAILEKGNRKLKAWIEVKLHNENYRINSQLLKMQKVHPVPLAIIVTDIEKTKKIIKSKTPKGYMIASWAQVGQIAVKALPHIPNLKLIEDKLLKDFCMRLIELNIAIPLNVPNGDFGRALGILNRMGKNGKKIYYEQERTPESLLAIGLILQRLKYFSDVLWGKEYCRRFKKQKAFANIMRVGENNERPNFSINAGFYVKGKNLDDIICEIYFSLDNYGELEIAVWDYRDGEEEIFQKLFTQNQTRKIFIDDIDIAINVLKRASMAALKHYIKL